MQIVNAEKNRLTSSITPEELGQAMAALDLSGVPPHKRFHAIQDHLMRIIANSIHDKTTATDIHASRILRIAQADH